MLGIHQYLWRLIPANPILLRVVDSGGKRRRDLFIRCAYLGLLVAFVVISLVSASGSLGGSGSLSSLAKTSASLFQSMSYLQLGLVALLAPVFTAGAITQEKDSQTYDILLATPLTNGQIVLGSLLSRLFFIIALLVSGIPVFSITQIFGGVAIKSIVISFLLAAGTAFATGALAMAIATFKVGTRRTIFSFYLFIVVYMAGGIVLDSFPQFHIKGRTVTQGVESHISYFTALNPFLALRVIFKDPTYAPPNFEDLPASQQSWPIGYMLSNPTGFYISFMFLFSFVLVLPSIVLLRRMAQSSTNLRSTILQKLKISTGDRNRKPRTVWTNPIAWREARTKASAARATVLRYSFIIVGLGAAVYLVITYANTTAPANAIVRSSYDERLQQITLPALDGKGQPKTLNVIPDATKVVLPTENPEDAPEEIDLRRMQGTMEVISYTTFAESPSTNSFVIRQMGRRDPSRFLNTLVVRPPARGLDAGLARKYLLGLCAVEFAVILLIVTNAAASTVTREKEDGTLDLLLTSPITSQYYIWGKLRGLVSFVVPLIAVPVISVAVFIAFDFFRLFGPTDPSFEWVAFWESILVMPATLVIVCAFAAIVGMQMSLRCRTTVMAVMASVGIVCGACGALGWCGYTSLNFSGASTFNLFIASFSPFTVLTMLIDPKHFGGRVFETTNLDEINGNRWILFVTAWISVGVYAFIVWTMYKSMVKNFDMTIRRQSR